MEILFEYRGSRRQMTVAESEGITRVLSKELHRIGKRRAQVFTASDELPSRSQGPMPDIYLLQKWSQQWDCYVDVAHCNEVTDGDRVAVIAKPKPTSKFLLLCCCGSANSSSYRVGKVGGSGKNKVPKTEEIQSLDYKFRAESAAGSECEADQQSASVQHNTLMAKEGEMFIRAQSGHAAWKLTQNSGPTPIIAQDELVSTTEIEDIEQAGEKELEGEGLGKEDREMEEEAEQSLGEYEEQRDADREEMTGEERDEQQSHEEVQEVKGSPDEMEEAVAVLKEEETQEVTGLQEEEDKSVEGKSEEGGEERELGENGCMHEDGVRDDPSEANETRSGSVSGAERISAHSSAPIDEDNKSSLDNKNSLEEESTAELPGNDADVCAVVEDGGGVEAATLETDRDAERS